MKTLTAAFALSLGLGLTAFAADITGFVEDSNCAAKPAMKDNSACAEKCIKGGAAAVLVSEDGKIFKIANQDKITSFAGKKVTVTGSVKEDTITVESVK